MRRISINKELAQDYTEKSLDELLDLRNEVAHMLFRARTEEQKRVINELLRTIVFSIGTATVVENY